MIMMPATAADLPEIVALEADGFERARWREESWRAEIEGTDRCVLVMRGLDDSVLGVAAFRAVGDVADLHRVVVRADQRGRGIARRLLQAGLDWAEAVGAETMLLEVEPGNALARTLYEKAGFAPLARRANYCGEGVHALVMGRSLVPDDAWRGIA